MMVAAAVLREVGGKLSIEDVDLPALRAGQVRIRLAAAGVCHSDLSLAGGTLKHAVPVVLGHEGAGRIVELGGDVLDGRAGGLAVGDPVVLNWAPACGACWWCAHAEPYLCAHADDARARPYAKLADGSDVYPGLGSAAFATETIVDAGACIPLPGDIPLAEAALLGCAVLTGVGAVLNAAAVMPGETVAVFGLGGVGLAALQGARIAGASAIIGVDPFAGKAGLAARLGATEFLEPSADLAKRIRALTGGRGVDHAIECVGRAETIRTAWSSTRRGGRTTVVGLGAATDTLTFNALEVAYFARTLSGCMYGSTDPAVDVPRLLTYYREGRLDLDALVTDRIQLSEVDEAFARMSAGTGARSVIVFE